MFSSWTRTDTCTTLAWIVLTSVQLLSVYCSDCQQLELSGASVQGDKTGTFLLQPSQSPGDSPVYRHSSCLLWLFHVNTSESETGYWIVGPKLGVPVGFLVAQYSAQNILGTDDLWQAWSEADQAWVQELSLRVTCRKFCETVIVQGEDLPKSIVGEYILQDNHIVGRPVYRSSRPKNAVYLFHYQHSYKCGKWIFGPLLDQEIGSVFAHDVSGSPVNVTGGWTVMSVKLGKYISKTIVLQCKEDAVSETTMAYDTISRPVVLSKGLPFPQTTTASDPSLDTTGNIYTTVPSILSSTVLTAAISTTAPIRSTAATTPPTTTRPSTVRPSTRPTTVPSSTKSTVVSTKSTKPTSTTSSPTVSTTPSPSTTTTILSTTKTPSTVSTLTTSPTTTTTKKKKVPTATLR